MKWSLALILSCWSLLTEAQTRLQYSLDWKKGKVVFESGDTVQCMVRYNTSLPEGIVQVQDGDNTLSLSVKDLLGFQYHDDSRHRDRFFQRFVLSDGEHNEGKSYFCEVIFRNSTFSILKHRAVGVPYEHMNYTRFIRKHAIITERFIVHQPSGKMLSLSRENALSLMENKLPEINSFIEENSIRFKSVTDYIRVLNFHAGL